MDQNLLISGSLAVIPSLLLVLFFYVMDANPEPRSVLLMTFFLGILIVIPVLAVALPTLFLIVPMLALGDGLSADFSRSAGMAFLSAAAPEEFFKWLVLIYFCSRHHAFDEPMDGIVYGAVVSLGFATFENITYVLMAGENAFTLAIVRGLTAVPVHASLGAIMGYFVGQAHFAKSGKWFLYTLSLVVPIFFHGVYDLGAMALPATLDPATGSPMLTVLCLALVFGTLVLLIVTAITLVFRLRATQTVQPSS